MYNQRGQIKKQNKSRISSILMSKPFLAVVSLYFIVIIELLAMTVYAQKNVEYSSKTPNLYVPKKTIIPKSNNIVKNPEPQQASFNKQYPYKIYIGKLGINTGVNSLGINAKGEMAVPASLYETSWYNKGTKPGEVGSAVIAGHYGAPGQLGVFRNLITLKAGDIIAITDSNNRKYNYQVYKIANIPEKGANLQEIFNKHDSKYLNLITCFGNWNQESFRYSDRTVVFSKIVE